MAAYEHSEILNYRKVYFVGSRAKKHLSTAHFDGKDGNYNVVSHDHIAYRYEVIRVIGQGSFGMVSLCFSNSFINIIIFCFLKLKTHFIFFIL